MSAPGTYISDPSPVFFFGNPYEMLLYWTLGYPGYVPGVCWNYPTMLFCTCKRSPLKVFGERMGFHLILFFGDVY